MRKDKLATAISLAKAHFRVEPNLKHVFLLEPINEGDPGDPIKLLEVVEGTLESGIMPVGFAADPARGIEYPVYIVELSPREYRDLRGKPLRFDERDWTVGQELLAS
jgi:hypothetical protein